MPEAPATSRRETAFGSTRPIEGALTGNVYLLPESTRACPTSRP